MKTLTLIAGLSAAALPVQACDIALALAVDVSGSVDPKEYRIQMQGLADGLRDGIVGEALVRAEAAVMVAQWTGSTRQAVSIPWVRITEYDDVEALAQRVENTTRKWRNFSTAIGEALRFTGAQFAGAPECRRKIIDVSGDGSSNEGEKPREVHTYLAAFGITVNGVVIEGSEDDLTSYFWENVITGEGAFVETASGFDDYPEKIKVKLQRETARAVSEYDASTDAIIRISAGSRR
jgi:Ca-activated chloride channel family protein